MDYSAGFKRTWLGRIFVAAACIGGAIAYVSMGPRSDPNEIAYLIAIGSALSAALGFLLSRSGAKARDREF